MNPHLDILSGRFCQLSGTHQSCLGPTHLEVTQTLEGKEISRKSLILSQIALCGIITLLDQETSDSAIFTRRNICTSRPRVCQIRFRGVPRHFG